MFGGVRRWRQHMFAAAGCQTARSCRLRSLHIRCHALEEGNKTRYPLTALELTVLVTQADAACRLRRSSCCEGLGLRADHWQRQLWWLRELPCLRCRELNSFRANVLHLLSGIVTCMRPDAPETL